MLKDIVQYFKADEGFSRVIGAMFATYMRYGRPFGAVRLENPSTEEESALSTFFKRDYYDQALIRIGLADFERQIHAFFSVSSEQLKDISLETVLEEYTGQPIGIKVRHEPKMHTFSTMVLHEVLPKFIDTPAEPWLREIPTQTRRAYRKWSERYLYDAQEVTQMVTNVASVFNKLPAGDKLIPLSEFADKFANSPDALDFASLQGRLFLRALASKFDIPAPSTVEECISLHLRAKILSYGVLSYITVRGLQAKIDTNPDPVCATFDNLNQPHILTLENLSQLTEFSAYGNKLFIIEDPLVYAAICEKLGNFKATVICPTNGAGAAFMYLLNFFHNANLPIYYAGNMTFDGLALADSLYLQYGKSLIPWRYEREDFTEIISQNSYVLPDEKKKIAMHSEVFASALSHMRKAGRTASSASIISLLIQDIKSLLTD
ncbi:MAG: TIGR02679 domain-containing protein [Defluviitaleaceae bacterium]|nr:TIGR02679 domain-containing protein [Defluviitaleaceae bacterium]